MEAQKALEVVTREAPDYPRPTYCSPRSTTGTKRKAEGDREAKVVEILKAKKQAQEPGSSGDLGPAYRGDDPPKAATPASEAHPKKELSRERPTVMRYSLREMPQSWLSSRCSSAGLSPFGQAMPSRNRGGSHCCSAEHTRQAAGSTFDQLAKKRQTPAQLSLRRRDR
jgi:hypothetical protein